MKIRLISTLIAALLFSLPMFSLPNTVAADPASVFTSLKGLAGEWEAKDEKGNPAITTWKLVSGGSAMMEEMPHESMVTMFHIDNDRLLMTHYCSAMNQPRMQAESSPNGKTIVFNFIDGTNIAKASIGHMQKMTLTIQDKDHFSETWIFSGGGKEQAKTIEYTRKQ
jgi:hypothetical protein